MVECRVLIPSEKFLGNGGLVLGDALKANCKQLNVVAIAATSAALDNLNIALMNDFTSDWTSATILKVVMMSCFWGNLFTKGGW